MPSYQVNKDTICASTIHGFNILLSAEDLSLTPHIAFNGSYEIQEEEFIKRVVKPGDNCIDVGANIGMFTNLMAQCVGPGGHVYAYEPNPIACELLQKSLIMNWVYPRVSVLRSALSNAPGYCQMRFSKSRLGDSTLVNRGDAGTFNKTIDLLRDQILTDVLVSSLDCEFAGSDIHFKLVKIDAEGFEHFILQGAKNLLDQHRIDILILEYCEEVYGTKWKDYLAELDYLETIGYVQTVWGINQLHKAKSGEQFSDRNILLVSEHLLC